MNRFHFPIFLLFFFLATFSAYPENKISSGIDLSKARLGDGYVEGAPLELFRKVEWLLKGKGYNLNIIKGRDFDLIDSRIFIHSIDVRNTTIEQLLDRTCKAGNWHYSIQNHSVIIDKHPIVENRKKKLRLERLFRKIIIPYIKLPNAKERKGSDLTHLRLYFNHIENLSKENDRARKGVTIAIDYDKDSISEGVLEDMYNNLPRFEAKNIPLSEMLYYIALASDLEYSISDKGVVTFSGKRIKTVELADEYTSCKSEFTIGNEYVQNLLDDDHLYFEVYLLPKGDKDKKRVISKNHYRLELNSNSFPELQSIERNRRKGRELLQINKALHEGDNRGKIIFLKNHLPDYNMENRILFTFFKNFLGDRNEVASVTFNISDWRSYPFKFKVEPFED
jgi:hypothetical protein